MNDATEAEANYFAMCLLMPEKMIQDDIVLMRKESPICFDDFRLDAMADRYQVDVKLLMMRLVQLGYIKF